MNVFLWLCQFDGLVFSMCTGVTAAFGKGKHMIIFVH